MIVDQLLGMLHGLLMTLVSAMPKWPWPLDSSAVTADLAGYMALLNSYVPFAAPLSEILKFVSVALPALLGYRVILFVYNRIRG